MTTVRYTTMNREVIAEKRSGSRRLYVPDPLGSSVALLDNTQTQVDTFTYWPYGEVRTSTGTTPPPFQFVGTAGFYSDGVGRAYVRARYLHTQKGRWLTQDPVGFSGGDDNFYRYVGNMVVTLVDPSGNNLPPGKIRKGNKLCRGVNGVGSHICTGQQWVGCMAKCGGINNVDFCCSTSNTGPARNCKCLHNSPSTGQPGRGPNYPPNNPGSGFGPPNSNGPHMPKICYVPVPANNTNVDWRTSHELNYDDCVTCVEVTCANLLANSTDRDYDRKLAACIQGGKTICTQEFLPSIG